MHDLRLVPTALCGWGAVILLLVTGSPTWAVALVVAVVLGCAVCGYWQHAVFVAGVTGASVFVATVRMRRAEQFQYPEHLSAAVAGAPKPLDYGGIYLPVRVDGLAPKLAVFVQQPESSERLAVGSRILVDATYRESDRPGLAPVVVRCAIATYRQPAVSGGEYCDAAAWHGAR